MFEMGGSLQEILLILVVALLVVRPKRLPEVRRMLARAMRELRNASEDFRSTVETHLAINESPAISPPTEPSPSVSSSPMATESATAPTTDREATDLETSEAVDDGTAPYIAQRGGRLFHRRECRWASRIRLKDRVHFVGAAEAQHDGLVPCPACEASELGALTPRA